MERKGFIGASDVSVILGINPFMTPLRLWAIKTGELAEENLDDVEAVEWGTRLERVVSDKFSDSHNVKLIARKTRYVHPIYTFLSCELDNIVAGTEELVEIKTVNAWAWKKWSNQDELPAHVIVQVMMQLGLSKRKVGWVACLCGGQKYIEKRVEFDKKMFDDLVLKCVAFWDLVQSNTPPSAIAADNDDIVDIYPSSNEQMQQIEELNTKISHLQELKAHISELENQQAKIEAEIKQIIGESAGFTTSQYKVRWTPQISKRLDTKLIKKEQPQIYEKYAKDSFSRVFTVTNNKGA